MITLLKWTTKNLLHRLIYFKERRNSYIWHVLLKLIKNAIWIHFMFIQSCLFIRLDHILLINTNDRISKDQTMFGISCTWRLFMFSLVSVQFFNTSNYIKAEMLAWHPKIVSFQCYKLSNIFSLIYRISHTMLFIHLKLGIQLCHHMKEFYAISQWHK